MRSCGSIRCPGVSCCIDGKAGPDVRGWALHAAVLHEPQGAAFHLTPGRHTLEYRAAPFPTLKCIVSVPASSADTCPLDQADSLPPMSDWSIKPKTRLLDLQATIDRLPATQAQALVAATQAQLASLNDAHFHCHARRWGSLSWMAPGRCARPAQMLTLTP